MTPNLDRASRLSGNHSSEPTCPPSLKRPPCDFREEKHTHLKIKIQSTCVDTCTYTLMELTAVHTWSFSSPPSDHK